MENVNESTVSNPLRFFINFINENGFKKYHNQFFLGLDLETFGFPIVNIDRNNESYTYQFANDDGKIMERKVSFAENIYKLFQIEKNKSLSHIIQNINLLNNNEREIITYLKLRLGELNRLIKIINNNEFSIYNLNQPLHQLVIDIYNQYNPFFNELKSPIIDESKKFIHEVKVNKISKQKTFKQKDIKKITTFKMLSSPNENTLVIYEILENLGFISNDSQTLENLKIAFNGSEINEPLNIKWDSMSKKSNVASLVRFIKLLRKLKIIEHIENSQICKILENTFVDSNEIPFQNLGVKVNEKSENPTNIFEKKLQAEIKSQFSDK